MKRSRSVAVGMAAWLTVAALGSAMAWAVISRAGGEVVSGSPAATATRDSRPSAEPSRTPEQRERSPRGTPVPGPGLSSPPPSPRASATSTPPLPSTTGSPSPPPPLAPSSSAALPSPPPPSPPVERHWTWQGPGGTIVVTCRGERAALEAAQPDSGYQVSIRDSGPDRVEVEFEGQGANEDARTRVRATCVSGQSRFEADVDRG